MMTVANVVDFLERFAPPSLAADWDNVGLLLGDAAAPVQQIMTCLTVTPETAAEAIQAQTQLIVSHHPILFRSVKRLTTATPEGRMLLMLACAGTAVYSPHTAFDDTQDGINDILARQFGLTEVGPLRRRPAPGQCKIVVFVPDADLPRVSDALFAAGAGVIGQYSECSFRLAGTGTFFGSDAANPTVGEKGRREEVSEWRLEAVCPEGSVDAAVAAIRRAHSYEEPAFDIYPLRPSPGSGSGRVGRLPRSVPLADLMETAKGVFKLKRMQYVGDAKRPVERLAVACGAGGDFIADAARAGAQALLTGEARFHDCLAAQALDLALLLPGHFASERIGVEHLAQRLQAQWPDLVVWASRTEADPVNWS
jgi:dinuclear metal center YbgI/SA1388 family protein